MSSEVAMSSAPCATSLMPAAATTSPRTATRCATATSSMPRVRSLAPSIVVSRADGGGLGRRLDDLHPGDDALRAVRRLGLRDGRGDGRRVLRGRGALRGLRRSPSLVPWSAPSRLGRLGARRLGCSRRLRRGPRLGWHACHLRAVDGAARSFPERHAVRVKRAVELGPAWSASRRPETPGQAPGAR